MSPLLRRRLGRRAPPAGRSPAPAAGSLGISSMAASILGAVLRAVVFDVDFTLAKPGPDLGPEGYRALGLRYGLDLDPSRYEEARAAAFAEVKRHPGARPRRGDLGALHRADDHRDGRDGATRTGPRSRWSGAGRTRRTSSCTRTRCRRSRRCGRAGSGSGCSRTRRANLADFVAHHGLVADAVLTSHAHGKTKPHESIFRALLGLLEVDAGEAVMVGDTLHDDIEGARAVGMQRRADRPRGPASGDRPTGCPTCGGSPRRSASNSLAALWRARTSSSPSSTTRRSATATAGAARRSGRRSAATQIGASLYELPDGERTYPYHFHNAMEEWLVVLDGTPTLREPDGERVLRRGDVVCFPTGPEGAHQVTRAGHGADPLGQPLARDQRVSGQRQGRARGPGGIFRDGRRGRLLGGRVREVANLFDAPRATRRRRSRRATRCRTSASGRSSAARRSG